MVLCREIDAEPYIAVNTGLGGPEAAAAEVEYVNGAATTTRWARAARRTATRSRTASSSGAIGNEMYGEWQLGHMPLAEYLKKHNRVVDAMRAVDPSIVPIAVGAVGEWSKTMLDRAPSTT